MEPGGREREPGPGAYGVPEFNKYKREYPSWKMGRARRNENDNSYSYNVPGPGAYQPKINVVYLIIINRIHIQVLQYMEIKEILNYMVNMFQDRVNIIRNTNTFLTRSHIHIQLEVKQK